MNSKVNNWAVELESQNVTFEYIPGIQNTLAEWSQNTILLVSTQAVYKAPQSTVQEERSVRKRSSRKSQSIRLECVAH